MLPAPPAKQTLGLPADRFIFCDFNQLYKVDPALFAVWVDILQRAPHSVLWLLRYAANSVYDFVLCVFSLS